MENKKQESSDLPKQGLKSGDEASARLMNNAHNPVDKPSVFKMIYNAFANCFDRVRKKSESADIAATSVADLASIGSNSRLRTQYGILRTKSESDVGAYNSVASPKRKGFATEIHTIYEAAHTGDTQTIKYYLEKQNALDGKRPDINRRSSKSFGRANSI